MLLEVLQSTPHKGLFICLVSRLASANWNGTLLQTCKSEYAQMSKIQHNTLAEGLQAIQNFSWQFVNSSH